MIIKDKPFLWICSYSGQPVLCWHHFSPAVLVSSSGSCRFEPLRVVRFHRLQAYQVRLSRLLAKRWGYVLGERELKQINGSFAIFPEWDGDIFDFRDAGGGFDDPDGDGLMHSGVFL